MSGGIATWDVGWMATVMGQSAMHLPKHHSATAGVHLALCIEWGRLLVALSGNTTSSVYKDGSKR